MGIQRGVYFEDEVLKELEKHSKKAKSFSEVVNRFCRLGLKDYTPSEREALKKEFGELMKEERRLRKATNAMKRSGAYAKEHVNSLVGGKGENPQFKRFPKRTANPTHLPEREDSLVDAPKQEIKAIAILLIRREEIVQRMAEIAVKLYPECSKKFKLEKDEKGEWRVRVKGKQGVLIPRDVSLSREDLLDSLESGKS